MKKADLLSQPLSCYFWRRGRDSNPRYLAVCMISSHVHSTRLCHLSAENKARVYQFRAAPSRGRMNFSGVYARRTNVHGEGITPAGRARVAPKAAAPSQRSATPTRSQPPPQGPAPPGRLPTPTSICLVYACWPRSIPREGRNSLRPHHARHRSSCGSASCPVCSDSTYHWTKSRSVQVCGMSVFPCAAR